MKVTGERGYLMRFDGPTGALMTIDYPHHEVHTGSMSSAYHAGTSKNDGVKINLYVKTPDTEKWAHAVFKWSASGAAYGRILEGPTVTANTGTNAQVLYNRNRNSSSV